VTHFRAETLALHSLDLRLHVPPASAAAVSYWSAAAASPTGWWAPDAGDIGLT
jgi:hypothetical protein